APGGRRPDVLDQADRRALLDAHHRRGVLHRVDVDRRRHPGPDVALDQRRRHPDLQLRGVAGGDLSLLPGPPRRWRDDPGRRLPDVLEPVAHAAVGAGAGGTPGAAAAFCRGEGLRTTTWRLDTKRSRRT